MFTNTEIVTGAIAAYGAFLSTVTFILHQVEKKQNIKVKLWQGFVAVGPSKPEDVIILEAANAGSVDVHLSNCRILLPNKQQFIAKFYYDKNLPITLAPGESVQAFVESIKFLKALEKDNYSNLVEVSAEFSNKAEMKFRSKKQTMDLTNLLFAKENA